MMPSVDAALDTLRRQWTRIGGRFTVSASDHRVQPEHLLAQTARHAEHDERLFFVAATWLGVHADLVNSHRLGQQFDHLEGKPSAVAGALCDVAKQVEGAPVDRLEAATRHCVPADPLVPLFRIMERYPSLLDDARENGLPVFERWGLIYHEVSLKPGAIRPASWLRTHCPELRMRELLGGTLEADILHLTLEEPRTASELQTLLGTSYSATHQAATILTRRGLLARTRRGRERPFVMPDDVRGWLQFPAG